jgi:hypothetical protein
VHLTVRKTLQPKDGIPPRGRISPQRDLRGIPASRVRHLFSSTARESLMIIIIGLVILIVAAVVGLEAVLGNAGHGHALTTAF